jgi:hypothetical protein
VQGKLFSPQQGAEQSDALFVMEEMQQEIFRLIPEFGQMPTFSVLPNLGSGHGTQEKVGVSNFANEIFATVPNQQQDDSDKMIVDSGATTNLDTEDNFTELSKLSRAIRVRGLGGNKYATASGTNNVGLRGVLYIRNCPLKI